MSYPYDVVVYITSSIHYLILAVAKSRLTIVMKGAK